MPLSLTFSQMAKQKASHQINPKAKNPLTIQQFYCALNDSKNHWVCVITIELYTNDR